MNLMDQQRIMRAARDAYDKRMLKKQQEEANKPKNVQQLSEDYAKQIGELGAESLKSSRELTGQLRETALGKGPLAGAQLRAAQSRNLAQTLAAAQTANVSPLATRQLLQQRSQQARELSQLGAQERLQAQQALAQQIAQQAGMGRADITTGFEIAKTPTQYAHEMEMARFNAQMQRDIARQQQQSGILGGLISGGAILGAAALSDENQKQAPDEENESKKRRSKLVESMASMRAPSNVGEGIENAFKVAADYIKNKPVIAAAAPVAMGAQISPNVPYAMASDYLSDEKQKKLPDAASEVKDMLDSLKAKKYQYKDTSLPGTEKGTRYGILAQDLEKSEMGKSLVKHGQHGKMVDTIQGFGAVLAAQAELNRRLKKLEKKG